EVIELEERLDAMDRRRLAPRRERLERGLDRPIHVGGGAERDASQELVVGRVPHLAEARGVGGDPAAADIVLHRARGGGGRSVSAVDQGGRPALGSSRWGHVRISSWACMAGCCALRRFMANVIVRGGSLPPTVAA